MTTLKEQPVLLGYFWGIHMNKLFVHLQLDMWTSMTEILIRKMPKVFRSSSMIYIHEIINRENICTEYNTNVLILPSTQQIKIYQYLSLWHLVALDTGICSEKGIGPCSPANSCFLSTLLSPTPTPHKAPEGMKVLSGCNWNSHIWAWECQTWPLKVWSLLLPNVLPLLL